MKTFRNPRFSSKTRLSSESAETLAISALSWIAADPTTLDRFLGLSGLSPQTLRAAAAAPGFLAGVLDFLAADEHLLVVFAAESGCDPAEVGRARQALGPLEDSSS